MLICPREQCHTAERKDNSIGSTVKLNFRVSYMVSKTYCAEDAEGLQRKQKELQSWGMAEAAPQNFLHTCIVLKVVSLTFLWCFLYAHGVLHWKHTNSSQSHLSNHLPNQLIWCLLHLSVYAPLGFVGMIEKFQKYQSASRKLSTSSAWLGSCPPRVLTALRIVWAGFYFAVSQWRVSEGRPWCFWRTTSGACHAGLPAF